MDTVNLNDFIADTLHKVTDGISKGKNLSHNFYLDNIDSKGIHFDIAVAFSQTKKGKVGGGINITVVNVGGAKEGSNTYEATNRIQFNVSYPRSQTPIK